MADTSHTYGAIDSGRKVLSGSAPFFQPKLKVGQADTPSEKEADAAADAIMCRRGNEPIQTKISPISESSKNTSESPVQRQVVKTNEVPLDAGVSPDVENIGSGQPLPDHVRKSYESGFGYDFSKVRVHTDQVAAKSASSVNALAYTSGNNIVFNEGQFSPHSDPGKRLLAHELTHVVQQNQSPATDVIQRKKVWDQQVPISTTHLLIFDVDDGDFVGGCVKQIVPHGGIKLVEKGVKLPIFDIHFGVFKNAIGEYCMFFYESVSGSCVTNCMADLKKLLEEFADWVKERVEEFLKALEQVGRFLVMLIELALVAAIMAIMVVLAGMILALA